MPSACGSRCRQDARGLFSASLCPECYSREVMVLTAAANELPPFPPLRLSADTQWHEEHRPPALTAEPPPCGPARPEAQSTVAVAAWISWAHRLPPGKVTGCARAAGQVGGWARAGPLPGVVHLGGFPGEPGRRCGRRTPGVQAADPCRLLGLVAASWLAAVVETRVETCWRHILTRWYSNPYMTFWVINICNR